MRAGLGVAILEGVEGMTMRVAAAALMVLAACAADDVPSDELDAGTDASIAHELSGYWTIVTNDCISQASAPCTEWVGVARLNIVINQLAPRPVAPGLENTTASLTWSGGDASFVQVGTTSHSADLDVFCVSVPAEARGPSNGYALCQKNDVQLTGDVSFSDGSVRRLLLNKD